MLEHQNEHFVRDFLQFSHYVASIFLRVFLWTSRFATSNLMFHARPPLIFSTSHKMPRPPCNLHLVTTWRSPDNAIRKKHATRKMTMKVVKVVLRLPRKLQLIWWKRCKSIAPATQNDYRHVMKHVSTVTKCQSATRNEATQHWKPPKRTTFAELAIGTAIRGSRDPPANGCDRKRNVEQTHPQPPDPQSETGTLATHSGKFRGFRAPYMPRGTNEDSWSDRTRQQRSSRLCQLRSVQTEN